MGRLRREHRAAKRAAERLVAARFADRPTADSMYQETLARKAVDREREQRWQAVGEAVAPFEERIRRLRLLAAVAPERLNALAYEAIARELDAEVNVVADDLFNGRLIFDELPKVLEGWISKGRAHLTHHDLHGPATQGFESAGTAGMRDEVWSWMDDGGVDLGHVELIDRLQVRADKAYDVGERDISLQFGDLIERLEDFREQDELAAIQTAVALPAEQRPTYLRNQETALRLRVQEDIDHLVDDLDLTIPRLVTDSEEARQGQDQVENAVRAAYDMSLWLAAKGGEPDNRWISLAHLRSELEEQADVRDEEPYLRADVDAALLRLTQGEASTVQTTAADPEYLLSHADSHAAIQVDGVAHHLIRINYPEYDHLAAESTVDHEISTAQNSVVGVESREQDRGERARQRRRTEVARSFASELDGVDLDAAGPAL